MKPTPRLARLVYNTPLLATPEAAFAVADVLAAHEHGEAISARASFGDDQAADAPYAVADGVATIPVRGELVNRGSWLNAASGLTSYEALGDAIAQANADYAVRAIVLDIDSPGGEAAGAMETAAKVRASAKPVVAYVNALAVSAAYAIAAGAREIVSTPSATLGHIGVVWMHLDRSQAMKDRGVKPTLLHAGAYKIDGHSMAPLAEEAKARIQSQIDQVYGLFVASVGAHRPALGEAGARATEAGMFIGAQAVEAKLADRVGDLDVARARALSRVNPRALMRSAMSDPVTEEGAALSSQSPAPAASTQEAELADHQAIEAARKEAASAERARIKSILDSEPAKGRGKLALHFAMETDMTPEAALKALAASPQETTRMDRVPDVTLRPNAAQRDVNPQAEVDAMWSGIVKRQA